MSIKELPPKMKRLKRLKVLDLTGCWNLQRIGRGIISSLEGLEELKMLDSFKKWEGEDREKKENAGLTELEKLTKLRCLEIEIQDRALVAENIRLSSKFDRFKIKLLYQSTSSSNFDGFLSNKKMCLNWKGATCLGDWIKMQLLRDTECLLLVGNGANKVGLTNLEKKIRYLELGECESMKKVVTPSMDDGGATIFPSMEHFKLFKLPNLEKIWDGRISSNSFQNLKILKLDDLPVLKKLWKISQNDIGKDFLPQLEVLYISECEKMEGVFLWTGDGGNENNSFHPITKIIPKLKELELNKLPNLVSFCQGIEGIEFPLLMRIMIKECEKMKGMVANGVTSNENNSGGSSTNAADTLHLFCQSQQVSFGCLKRLETDWNPFCSHTIHESLFIGLEKLEIYKCAASWSLFTSSMARNLLNLKELGITSCIWMEEVIKDDEDRDTSGDQRALLFPKLHTLKLWHLPNLVSLCKWECNLEFPSLRKVVIRNCPNMKNFTLGSVAAPNLEFFNTDLEDDLLRVNYESPVPFNNVKELIVEGNVVPLYCYEIHGSVFDRLEALEITNYEDCMGLFSSSITENLVNLTTLTITFCPNMVKVIHEEKEKVVSGAQRTTIPFPKLQMIELSNLPALVSFCKWKCDVELPSLRRVEIYGCHNMKSFTLGHLNTPKLEIINWKDVGGVKDLNGFLQQREEEDEEEEEEERQEEEDEDEEEEEEERQEEEDEDEEEEEGEGEKDNDDDHVKYLNGLVQQGFRVGAATVLEASRGRRRRGRRRGRGRQ